jgi:hypothetical protein
MQNIGLRIAAAAIPFLLWDPVAAQNPCGYAFSITGQKLFDDHCAGCHGLDGMSKGAFASGQSKQPADLTGITKRNNGQYPAERIAEIIRYGGGLPGHEKDHAMPVWGKVFSGECGPAFSRRAVVELNRYLETLQKWCRQYRRQARLTGCMNVRSRPRPPGLPGVAGARSEIVIVQGTKQKDVTISWATDAHVQFPSPNWVRTCLPEWPVLSERR